MPSGWISQDELSEDEEYYQPVQILNKLHFVQEYVAKTTTFVV
jgi:hypothetical protein